MVKAPKILLLDLDKNEVTRQERKEFSSAFGGVALGVQLMKEHCLFEEDSLLSQQPIVFTKGPLNTIFPVATKTCALFKSPLTQELGESYAGMRLSMAMALAGIDGLVIKGASSHPIYIHIDGEEVTIKNAAPLWGLNTDETTRLLHDAPGHRGLRSILTIGQAGERRVNYSCVTVDTYRHFGRLGLGCVFGSKNIKAIVIEGSYSQPVENSKEYSKVYKAIYQKVTATELMEKYHGLGTSINVEPLNAMKALPSYNFSKSEFIYSDEISGEAFAEDNLIKKIACSGCPIGCIHIALLRKKYGDPYEYESSTIAYDHELIYSLGAMLGINNRCDLLKLMERAELLGLDAIASGVFLAWVTEAYLKGIIANTEVIASPAFGDAEGYLEIMELIVAQPNEFYKGAAKGTYYTAQKYGGLDFAAVLGKNEVAGYHTGYGNILGQAVGARHSHLDNAGYSFDQELEKPDKELLVDKLIEEEVTRNLLNSLTICLFARKIYDIETIMGALKAIGIDITKTKLEEIGKITFIEKQIIKERMGYRHQDLFFPKRFFETPARNQKLYKEEIEDMLKLYINKIEALKKEHEEKATELFSYSNQQHQLV